MIECWLHSSSYANTNTRSRCSLGADDYFPDVDRLREKELCSISADVWLFFTGAFSSEGAPWQLIWCHWHHLCKIFTCQTETFFVKCLKSETEQWDSRSPSPLIESKHELIGQVRLALFGSSPHLAYWTACKSRGRILPFFKFHLDFLRRLSRKPSDGRHWEIIAGRKQATETPS